MTICQLYIKDNKEDIKNNIYIKKNKKEKIENNIVVTYDENGAIQDAHFSPEAEKAFLAEIELIRKAYAADSLSADLKPEVSVSTSANPIPDVLSSKSYRKNSEFTKIQQGGRTSGYPISSRAHNPVIPNGAMRSKQKTPVERRSLFNIAQKPKPKGKPQPGQSLGFASGANAFALLCANSPAFRRFVSAPQGRELAAGMGAL